MNDDSNSTTVPPFPPRYRASGVLLHITSLPSAYGIGDVGPAAMKWIDLLHEAGQSWWQSLPLGPTGYGNSPYQALSSFAGNELLISPDWLIEDGLLSGADCMPIASSASVDVAGATRFKRRILKQSWNNFSSLTRPALKAEYDQFCTEQAHWLDDYALFRALKTVEGNAHYLDWPENIVKRSPAALAKARSVLAQEINEVRFAQFLIFRQGARLKRYGRAKGIRMIGDLPFFVSPDSSDVWSNPELFLLDEKRRPRFVAGVPPDYFSRDGQFWGNPVFDWDALRQTGYRWCVERHSSLISSSRRRSLRPFPRVCRRLAHTGWVGKREVVVIGVRALVQSSSSPPSAHSGNLPFIAEDLGYITPDVYALRDQFHLPGMRVLQFGFDGQSQNPHLPHNYTANTVVYTGTHDNPPSRAWYEQLPADRREDVWRYLRLAPADRHDVTWELIRSSMVLSRCPGHRSVAGSSQSWSRGTNEHPRECRR